MEEEKVFLLRQQENHIKKQDGKNLMPVKANE